MTVKELIEKLKEMPDSATVVFDNWRDNPNSGIDIANVVWITVRGHELVELSED
jgi:hypothetical protein